MGRTEEKEGYVTIGVFNLSTYSREGGSCAVYQYSCGTEVTDQGNYGCYRSCWS